MPIKAKHVKRSRSIDDLIHVFINFNFENDLSQLKIENPMLSSNLYEILKVEKTSSKLQSTYESMIRIRGNCISSNSKEHNKVKGNYMFGFCTVHSKLIEIL